MKGGSYIKKDGKLERVEGTKPAPLPQKRVAKETEAPASESAERRGKRGNAKES